LLKAAGCRKTKNKHFWAGRIIALADVLKFLLIAGKWPRNAFHFSCCCIDHKCEMYVVELWPK